MHVVALVSDLMFQSKIEATAKQLNVPVNCVRELIDVLMEAGDAKGLIIDLDVITGDVFQTVREARSIQPDLHIVGFLSHVQVELAAKARAAGINQVMPRSEFTEKLPDILKSLHGM